MNIFLKYETMGQILISVSTEKRAFEYLETALITDLRLFFDKLTSQTCLLIILFKKFKYKN